MNTQDHNTIIQNLEATCGCTFAARTAAEAMRQLVTEHHAMIKTLQHAAHVLAELNEQTPELLALRHRIIGDIKAVTPEYFGEVRK